MKGLRAAEKNDLLISFFVFGSVLRGNFRADGSHFDGTTSKRWRGKARWFNFLETKARGREEKRLAVGPIRTRVVWCWPGSVPSHPTAAIRQHTWTPFLFRLPSPLECLKILLYKFHLIWFPHTRNNDAFQRERVKPWDRETKTKARDRFTFWRQSRLQLEWFFLLESVLLKLTRNQNHGKI